MTPVDDAKIHAVKSFVTTPGVNAEKLLIFTESTVTARYLYNEPSQSNDAGTVDILTGEDAKDVAKMTRFAPASNGRPDRPAEQQIRILIATDVLSEGQNRRDCGRALNYDRRWNPVTLIQRCGRVDGITAEHEVIHRHNMLSDAGVDQQISLTGRLSARAQSFHDLIGLTTPSCSRRNGSTGTAFTLSMTEKCRNRMIPGQHRGGAGGQRAA